MPETPEIPETGWAAGRIVTMEMLEDEGYRRAIDGVAKPIFQRGCLLGERRIRSERMLKFLLVANEFEKFGKPEVPSIEPGQEPGRQEFLANLNAIYAEDAELRQAYLAAVNERCDRLHAERMAELRRQHGMAPPCTHTAFGGEDEAPPFGEDTERAGYSDQLSVNSDQSDAGEGGNLDLDLDLNHDLDQSGKDVPSSPATSVAPSCTHSASGGKAPPGAGGKTAKQDKSKSMSIIKSKKESGVEGEGHNSEGADSGAPETEVGKGNIHTLDFDRFAKAPPRPQSASGGANAAYYSSVFAVMDAAAGYGPTGRSEAGSGRRGSGSSADTGPVEETAERRSDPLSVHSNQSSPSGTSEQLSVISEQLSVISEQ